MFRQQNMFLPRVLYYKRKLVFRKQINVIIEGAFLILQKMQNRKCVTSRVVFLVTTCNNFCVTSCNTFVTNRNKLVTRSNKLCVTSCNKFVTISNTCCYKLGRSLLQVRFFLLTRYYFIVNFIWQYRFYRLG